VTFDLPSFALVTGALLMAPGPTNALLATAGAGLGARRAVSLILFEAAGYGIAVALLRAGLGPILDAHPAAGTALRLACGAWLAWAALGLWRAGAASFVSRSAVTGKSVFIATLLNPKALVLAYGILPAGAAWSWRETAVIAIAIAASGLTWVLAGSVVGRSFRSERGHARMNRGAAVVMAVFAGMLSGSALGF
jgi:threonine/homoserine/homoserine lactone efflux protein